MPVIPGGGSTSSGVLAFNTVNVTVGMTGATRGGSISVGDFQVGQTVSFDGFVLISGADTNLTGLNISGDYTTVAGFGATTVSDGSSIGFSYTLDTATSSTLKTVQFSVPSNELSSPFSFDTTFSVSQTGLEIFWFTTAGTTVGFRDNISGNQVSADIGPITNGQVYDLELIIQNNNATDITGITVASIGLDASNDTTVTLTGATAAAGGGTVGWTIQFSENSTDNTIYTYGLLTSDTEYPSLVFLFTLNTVEVFPVATYEDSDIFRLISTGTFYAPITSGITFATSRIQQPYKWDDQEFESVYQTVTLRVTNNGPGDLNFTSYGISTGVLQIGSIQKPSQPQITIGDLFGVSQGSSVNFTLNFNSLAVDRNNEGATTSSLFLETNDLNFPNAEFIYSTTIGYAGISYFTDDPVLGITEILPGASVAIAPGTVGEPRSINLFMKNNGLGDYNMSGYEVSGDIDSITSDPVSDPQTQDIIDWAPGTTSAFTFEINTATSGLKEIGITVVSNYLGATKANFNWEYPVVSLFPEIEVFFNSVEVLVGSSVQIGQAIEGDANIFRTFEIQNNGDDGLFFTSIGISGTQTFNSSPEGNTLAVGLATNLVLELDTTTVGNYEFDITLETNDPTNPEFTFNGSYEVLAKPAPILAFSDSEPIIGITFMDEIANGATIALGTYGFGITTSFILVVRNSGNSTLFLNTVGITGSSSVVLQEDYSGSIVNPSENFNLQWNVKLDAVDGEKNHTITIESNDEDQSSFEINFTFFTLDGESKIESRIPRVPPNIELSPGIYSIEYDFSPDFIEPQE